jgi:hypothetical protein
VLNTAYVNLQGKCSTPLIAACEEGHASVVAKLVMSGAKVNLLAKWEYIPLIAICGGGHMSVVTELMIVGTDVNL